jgi:hypothetical protein
MMFYSAYEFRWAALCYLDQLLQVFSRDFGKERKFVFNSLEQTMLETVPAQLIVSQAYFVNQYQDSSSLMVFALIIGVLRNAWAFTNYYRLKYKYE